MCNKNNKKKLAFFSILIHYASFLCPENRKVRNIMSYFSQKHIICIVKKKKKLALRTFLIHKSIILSFQIVHNIKKINYQLFCSTFIYILIRKISFQFKKTKQQIMNISEESF